MGSVFKNSSQVVYMYEVFAHFKVTDGCAENKASYHLCFWAVSFGFV